MQKHKRKKNIVIWDSTKIISGGTKVSLDIYELLKDDYHCIFFIPEFGQVSEELKRRKIDYEVVRFGDYSFLKKKIKDILKLICYFPFVFLKVYHYVRKNRIDLIYSNAVRTSIWTSLIGNICSIPIIWHIHHFFEDNKAKFIINKFGKCKSVKKIIFVSDFVRNQFPALSTKSILVYNGIDVNKLKQKADASDFDLSKKANIPEDNKIISIITHVLSTKGQDVLLKSIPHILKENQKVHFLVTGSILEESYYCFLKKLVVDLGIENHVSFLGYCSDIPGLLNYVHTNVVTSVEGCPMIVLECLALDIPVVVPDIGGSKEIAKKGNAGLIYEYGNEKDLAQKILMFLKDDNLYSLTRKNCKECSDKLDIKTFHRKIKQVVVKAIGETD